jgi:hypothetical protein
MRTLRNAFLLIALSALACSLVGCKAIQAASDVARQYEKFEPQIKAAVAAGVEAAETGKTVIAEVKALGGEIKAVEAEARAKADEDGDGKLNLSEMIAYAAALAAGGTELARRKLNSDTVKATDELYDKVAALEVDAAKKQA